MLLIILNGHIEDVLILHDKEGNYCGMITYKSLLKGNRIEDAIIYDKLILDEYVGLEQFWKRHGSF